MPSIFDNIDDFEDGRPDFDDQDPKRQKQLIKNTIQMMTATTGIYVMRLSAAEVKRIRHEKTDRNDPLKLALTNLDEIFKNCKAKTVDVDTAAKRARSVSSCRRQRCTRQRWLQPETISISSFHRTDCCRSCIFDSASPLLSISTRQPQSLSLATIQQ